MTPPTAALPIADCPFCGGSPKIIQRAHPAVEHVALAWIVQCSGCTAETCSEHRQWAIDYWNRRAPAVQATADADGTAREIVLAVDAASAAMKGPRFAFEELQKEIAAIVRQAASPKAAQEGCDICLCEGSLQPHKLHPLAPPAAISGDKQEKERG